MNEGYLPLYRKYRPQKLDDVVGQAHIKSALSNAIALGKISHAYLFTGPRGTGKTSTARILAKSLNCVNGPTITPCEECESCKAIINTVPIDVIEIDAASNRSVEDAHNILEKVQYAPVNGKYKIYIIDEVHMLTTQAFNALLKTLEEPPKNVVFILATTESHKVLDTIKSRCQRFDFKRITTNDIIAHLKKIADKENIKISDGAIATIAKSSAGGMRDSLALLDQVSTIGSAKEITEADINNLLGRLSFDVLLEMANYISKSDAISAVSLLEKIYNDGNEPLQILTNLMLFFKNVLLAKSCNDEMAIELTGLSDIQIKSLAELKNSLETHQILFLINKTADYIKEVKQTTNQQMWLEVALIDLANLTNNTKLYELQARLDALEGGSVAVARPQVQVTRPVPQVQTAPVQSVPIQKVEAQPQIASQVTQKTEVEVAQSQTAQVVQQPVQAGGSDVKSLWVQILKSISSQADQALFKLANPVEISQDGITLTFKAPNWVEKSNNPEKKQCIMDAAELVLGKKNIPITIRQPLPDDAKFEKVVIPQEKKSIVPPKSLVDDEPEVTEQEVETVKKETKEQNTRPANIEHSDQGNMVKNLFDGRFLDEHSADVSDGDFSEDEE